MVVVVDAIGGDAGQAAAAAVHRALTSAGEVVRSENWFYQGPHALTVVLVEAGAESDSGDAVRALSRYSMMRDDGLAGPPALVVCLCVTVAGRPQFAVTVGRESAWNHSAMFTARGWTQEVRRLGSPAEAAYQRDSVLRAAAKRSSFDSSAGYREVAGRPTPLLMSDVDRIDPHNMFTVLSQSLGDPDRWHGVDGVVAAITVRRKIRTAPSTVDGSDGRLEPA